MAEENPNSNLYNKSSLDSADLDNELSETAENSEDKSSSSSKKRAAKNEADSTADDQQTDQAVEDIVHHESDEILAAEDSDLGKSFAEQPKNLKEKMIRFFKNWWDNKRLRYSTLAGLILVILFLAAWKPSRDFALNIVGFRGSASVIVLDQTTSLPLKDVSAILAGKKAYTNDNGVAIFKDVKLGSQQLTVQKIAFAPVTANESIGLGNNNLGKISLKAIGTQYKFMVTDYLSGKPIQKAEASSGQSSAFSDKTGKIILTTLSSSQKSLPVTISANNYKNTSTNVPTGSTATAAIQLVPAGKDVYVSNSTGDYNVYKSDLDGQNKQLLLAGTGNENANVELIVSPDNKEAALVSTRDNIRDADGYLLSALTLINISTGTSVTIDHAEQIQLIDWAGTRIIYSETLAGASAANSQRERIISYDYSKNTRTSLASANLFNAVIEAGGNVYYAVSSTDPSAAADFFKINSDGTGRQTILNKEVWTALRTHYDTFALQTATGWYNYTLDSNQPTQANQPSNYMGFTFVDNQAGDKSLWTDYRDGKGVLLVHNIKTNQDTTVLTQGGLSDPTRWVSSKVVIYRVSTEQESADYVVSLNGGLPKKITDVSSSNGVGTGY